MVVYLSGYIAGHFNSFVIHMSSKVPPSAVNIFIRKLQRVILLA